MVVKETTVMIEIVLQTLMIQNVIMGTNYYARILPTKERKEEIKKAIDSDDFKRIHDLTYETYGSHQYAYEFEDFGIQGVIHLGKNSCGWKFLWNPNVYVKHNGHTEKEEVEPGHTIYHFVEEPDSLVYLYPLTKEGIREFIGKDNVEIFDEYNEKQDKEEFLEFAFNKEGIDSKTYYEKHSKECSYNCSSELITLLEKEGIDFISNSRSDFYSDGLRFATCTEFS